MKTLSNTLIVAFLLFTGGLLIACSVERVVVEPAGDQEEAQTETPAEEKISAAESGRITYFRDCMVCHGAGGEGVENLGKSLTSNQFIAGVDDAAVAEFIATGRDASHPLNTTGVDMLPYGGQEAFPDEVMDNLVAYLRVLSITETTITPRPSDQEEPTPASAAEVQPVDEPGEELSEEVKEQAISIMLRARPKCFTCHRIGERGNKSGPGPDLSNIGLVAQTRVPELNARKYLEQAILDPGVYVVPDCPAGPCVDAMPKDYDKQLNEEKLEAVVQYLLSLQSTEK